MQFGLNQVQILIQMRTYICMICILMIHLNKNMKTLKRSASIIFSKIANSKSRLFAENPNFRGSWYGTNKLFLNGLFFGDKISVPD